MDEKCEGNVILNILECSRCHFTVHLQSDVVYLNMTERDVSELIFPICFGSSFVCILELILLGFSILVRIYGCNFLTPSCYFVML